MELDGKLAYELWTRLIHDEELYAAVMANEVEALVKRRSLAFSDAEREAMAQLRAQRGVRWSMENLRFRCAMQVAETVSNRLPRTTKLLTRGNRDWMQEIAFEYLAYYGWTPLGFNTIAEAERFVDYVKVRIQKRRISPPFLDEVLALEAALLEVQRQSGAIDPSAWPSPPALALDDEVIEHQRLAWAPCVSLIESAVDLGDWLTSADPAVGVVRPGPMHVLCWVPSPQAKHRIQILGEGARLLFAALRGAQPTGSVIAALARDFDADPAELRALIRGWWSGNALHAVAEQPAPLAAQSPRPVSSSAGRPRFAVEEVVDQSGAAWRDALVGLAEKVPALLRAR